MTGFTVGWKVEVTGLGEPLDDEEQARIVRAFRAILVEAFRRGAQPRQIVAAEENFTEAELAAAAVLLEGAKPERGAS